MSSYMPEDEQYRRDLGDGLVLRWSHKDDAEPLAKLYSYVFRDKAEDPLNLRVAAWTRDMISGQHPLIGSNDFAVVENTRTGEMVASTCLMQAEWDYDGIAFPVGRPEIVASLPEHRNRGLVRAIFDLVHARSDARGNLAMGITGISYYYRQFGYEYAPDLGGSCVVPTSHIPKAKEGEPEPYTLREATAEDLPLVLRLYERERSRATLTARINPEYWHYTMGGHSAESGEGWRTMMIQDPAGAAVGYVLTRRLRWGDTLGIIGFVVEQGTPMPTVVPPVLRALREYAERTEPWKPGDTATLTSLRFMLHRSHPLYDVIGTSMGATYNPPYAWYVRVPDLPGFIRHVAPVLEQRLAASPASGYSGELILNFYRGGMKLTLEQGRLTGAEDWRRDHNWGPAGNAGFPPLVFLQLLFGHRSLDELRHAFHDVWADDTGRALLEAMFPPQKSWVLPLD